MAELLRSVCPFARAAGKPLEGDGVVTGDYDARCIEERCVWWDEAAGGQCIVVSLVHAVEALK